MLHAKDHKTRDMFEPFSFLGPKRLQRMKQTWAGLFRHEILAEMPVDQIRRHYDPVQGRPTKELHAMLGAVLLQQMLDLTDEETVDQFAFNLQWHYALNITGESDQVAYLCPKTLWTMRALVTREEVAPLMFDVVTEKLKTLFGVDTQRQRLDSMHIFSNMRHLGRVSLMAQTIRKFLVNLKRKDGQQFEALDEEVKQRYMPQRAAGVFAMVKPSESARSLQILAQDLWDLMERFGSDEAIRRMHSYRLLVRLFSEPCRVEFGETSGERKIVVKANREVPSDSLQNPSDPDATYDGHKGKGYQVQVMESYSEEGQENEDDPPLKLITYVEAQPAHESDSQAVEGALQKTRQEERAPQQLLADSLYGSDNNCRRSEQQGVELVAPVKSNKPAPPVGLADFCYDGHNRARLCPQGQVPVRTRQQKQRHSAQFDAAVCRQCGQGDQCPVKPGHHGHYLRYSNKELRLEQRKAYEQTDEFRDRYRFRSGCEATMSELDRKTGIKRLRVRGMSAVSLCVFLKAAGVNLLRAARFNSRRSQPKDTPAATDWTLWGLLYRGRGALPACFAVFSSRLADLAQELDKDTRFPARLTV
jgi:hypothetical protein